jgi:hypothetical protein
MVDGVEQRRIHRLDRRKRAIAMADDVGVPKVRV